MANKVQIRAGTAAAWTAANPILLLGEQGWESDTGLFKIGDGATAWTGLGYWISVLNLKEVSYVPVFTNLGVCTAISFSYVRAGNKIKIIGKFTTGVTVAAEARISLPGALISDAALIPSVSVCGTFVEATQWTGALVCLIESGVGYMTIGWPNSAVGTGGLAKINGNTLPNATVHSLQAELPVSGWNGP